MAYADPLDQTVPVENDFVSQGDDYIREVKRALRQRINSFFQDVDADPLVPKDGIITTAMIADEAITGAKVAPHTLTAAHFALDEATANLRKLTISGLQGWPEDNLMLSPSRGLQSFDPDDGSNWNLPVTGLPAGSTIKKVSALVRRQSTDSWIRFWLGAHNLDFREGMLGIPYADLVGPLEQLVAGYGWLESPDLGIVVLDSLAYTLRINSYRAGGDECSFIAAQITYQVSPTPGFISVDPGL